MGSFYTGRGDNGETDTMGFGRMGKESPLANALGDVDELNSLIGVAIANTPDKHLCDVMIGIQNKLFTIGAQLSAAPGSTLKSNAKITGSDIKDLEDEIDDLEAKVPKLKKFVLPGGSQSGALLHLSRAVARRAERSVVLLSKNLSVSPELISYLNRLSSFLFVSALFINRKEGIEEQNPVY